jgi:hypothetical protein
MNKILNQKKGIALMTVLLTFLSLFILLSAIVYLSIQNTDNTKLTSDYSKAYYIAESSLNKRMAEVNSLFTTLANSNPNSADLFTLLENEIALLPTDLSYDQTTDDDSAVLSIIASDGSEDYPSYMFYTITATGTVNGTSRTLSKEVGFAYSQGGPGLIIGKAILTQRGMIIGSQNSTVVGPIASNLLDNTEIDLKSTQTLIPMAFVPIGKTSYVKTASRIGNRITEVDMPFIFPIINYPVIPTASPTMVPSYTFVNSKATINVFGYSYLENMVVAQGETLVINLGSRGTASTRKMLRVKNINVSGNIRVIGTGRLLLVFEYGKGTLTMGSKFNVCGDVVGSCQAADPDYTKFLFYLKTPYVTKGDLGNYPKLVFSNLQLFYGSLLAEYVDVEVKSSNFKGHIVSSGNEVNFSANAYIKRALFYAPFATLKIDSNAVLSGSLISNYFEIANPQTIVTYLEVDKETFPFSIDFPTTTTTEYEPGSTDIIEGPIVEN